MRRESASDVDRLTPMAVLLVYVLCVFVLFPFAWQLGSLMASSTCWSGEWDGDLRVGLLAVLVGIAWRWRRNSLVQWAALTAGAVLVLSLGPTFTSSAAGPARHWWRRTR